MTTTGERDLPARRYSDAEVRLLLERAASLQVGAPAAPQSDGLTLAQLEEIAAEAHIDVAQLRQAARELDTEALRPAGTAARLAGAPFSVHAEQTLPFEIDASEFGQLVHGIGAVTGESGTAGAVGRTFTWNAHAASGRRTEVRVSALRGSTHIWVEERYTEIAAGVFGGLLGGVGGASIGLGAALASGVGALTFAVPVVAVAGTYAACRAGYRAYVDGRSRRVHALCDRITQDLVALHDDSAHTT
jgi:hypothetical protein